MRLLTFTLVLGLALLTACQPRTTDSLEALRSDIQEELGRSEGNFAVAFRDVQDTTRTLLINEHEEFHAASTMKTPVMIEVFKQAAAGKFDLQDSIRIKNEFTSIYDGTTFTMDIGEDSEEKLYGRIGEKETIYNLVVDMITFSSNLATNIIIDLVGAGNVTQSMRDLGAPDIQVLRGVEDLKAYRAGMSNTTTAFDLLVIMEQIARGKAVSPKASQAMIDILDDQHFNDLIPAQLPEAVRVAHKTGWITQVRHDSGIVILPDGRKYVLVLLSKEWHADALATEIMANVSRMVYEYFISGSGGRF